MHVHQVTLQHCAMSFLKLIGGFGFIDYVKGAVKYLGQLNYDQHRNENTAHGTGLICYPNGALYYGAVANNNTSGQGIRFSPNGTLIMGNFMVDGASGHGFIKYPNGVLYDGDLRCNQPSGQGKMYFPCGTIIDCYWTFGKPTIGIYNTMPIISSTDNQVFYQGNLTDQFVPHGEGVLRRGERWFDGRFENGILREGVYQIGRHCIYQERVKNWGSLMCDGPPKESTLDISTATIFGISQWFSQPGIQHLGEPGIRFLDHKHPLFQAFSVAIARMNFLNGEAQRFFLEGTSTHELRELALNVNPKLKQIFDFTLALKQEQWNSAKLNPIERATAIMAPLWHGTKASGNLSGLTLCDAARGIFANGFIACMSGSRTGARFGPGIYAALPNHLEYSMNQYACFHQERKPDGTTDHYRSLLACVGAVGTSKANPNAVNKFPNPDDTFTDTEWYTLANGGPQMCVFQDGSLIYPLVSCYYNRATAFTTEAKIQRENPNTDDSVIYQMGRDLAMEIKTWDRQEYKIDMLINTTSPTPHAFKPPPAVTFMPLSPLPVLTIEGKTYTGVRIIEPRDTMLGKRPAPETQTTSGPPTTRQKSDAPAAMTIDLTTDI